jgi:hypothetical protein
MGAKKQKLTKREKLEALAKRPLPEPFGRYLREVNAIVEKMRAAAAEVGVDRQFTPDGRFLGDLGEVIAKIHFGLTLHSTQREGEDGQCQISKRTVEVKLRSKSTLIWVKKVPDVLVAIYLSPSTNKWGVVCNGPGAALLANAEWSERHNRFTTDLSTLYENQAALPPSVKGVREEGPAARKRF